jgi:hypothetical protein
VAYHDGPTLRAQCFVCSANYAGEISHGGHGGHGGNWGWLIMTGPMLRAQCFVCSANYAGEGSPGGQGGGNGLVSHVVPGQTWKITPKPHPNSVSPSVPSVSSVRDLSSDIRRDRLHPRRPEKIRKPKQTKLAVTSIEVNRQTGPVPHH